MRKDLTDYRNKLTDKLSIPALLPLQDGLERLIPVIQKFKESKA